MTTPVVPVPSADGNDASDKAATKDFAAALVKRVVGTPPAEPAAEPALAAPPVEPGAVALTPAVAEPGTPLEPTPAPVDVPPVEGTPPIVSEDAAATAAAEAGVSFTEAVAALNDLGIAVDTDDVPQEIHGKYNTLLQNVRQAVNPVFDELESTRTNAAQLESFKQRMSDNPLSILRTLMFTKPDDFKVVVEEMERASTDEQYRDDLINRIDNDARDAQITAREQRLEFTTNEAKGRRAHAEVQAAARRYSVDLDVADEVVASHIKASGGGEFNLSSIDGIVSRLRPKAAPALTPKHVTPAQAAAVADAPSTPTVGDSPPVVPARPGASSGFDTDAPQRGRGGFIKSLIRAASAKADLG